MSDNPSVASGDAEIVASRVPGPEGESLSPVQVTLEQPITGADTESVARNRARDVSEVSLEAAHQTFGQPFGIDDPELATALDAYHRAAAERARRLADQVDRSLILGILGTGRTLFNPQMSYAEFREKTRAQNRGVIQRLITLKYD